MTAANVPNEIVNLTPADAVPVNQNFQYIEQFTNAELINRDGSVAMTAPLTLSGTPTQPLQAAPKNYVDSFFPVGVVLMYPGETAPSGNWMLCRGQALSTASYPALFAVCGYRFGGSGGTFNLPDLRNRSPVGVDPTVTAIDVTGKTGGTTAVPLLQHSHAMPHTHTIAHTHAIDHDHPNVLSGTQTANHVHSFSDTTSLAGNHTHASSGPGSFIGESSGVGPLHAGSGNDMAVRTIALAGNHTHTISGTTGSNNASHAHHVNIPGYVGGSGGASTGSSGGVSTPNTSNAGTVAPEMRPPFQAMNFIIRVA